MKKKKEKSRKKCVKRDEKEIEKLVSRTGLKGSARDMAAQYGRGMLEGMHIAFLAVVERLLRAGNSKEEVESFLSDMLESCEIEQLIKEAEKHNKSKIA